MDHPSVVTILVHGGEGPIPSACLQRALQILTRQKLMFQNEPESSQLIAGTGQQPMVFAILHIHITGLYQHKDL